MTEDNQEDKNNKSNDLQLAIDEITKDIDRIYAHLAQTSVLRGWSMILDYDDLQGQRCHRMAYKASNPLEMIGLLDICRDNAKSDYFDSDEDSDDLEPWNYI